MTGDHHRTANAEAHQQVLLCVSAVLLPIPGDHLGTEREDLDVAVGLVRDKALFLVIIQHFEATPPIAAWVCGTMTLHVSNRAAFVAKCSCYTLTAFMCTDPRQLKIGHSAPGIKEEAAKRTIFIFRLDSAFKCCWRQSRFC